MAIGVFGGFSLLAFFQQVSLRMVTHCAGGFLWFSFDLTCLNCVCDFLHIERVRLMCFSFLCCGLGHL